MYRKMPIKLRVKREKYDGTYIYVRFDFLYLEENFFKMYVLNSLMICYSLKRKKI